jgi:glucosylglycerate phosphorylase
VLLAFQTGSAERLRSWAAQYASVSPTATFFNFLDSHDGVGLMAIRDIVPPAEIERMVETARQHGALVSYRDNGDGARSPYALNVTWYSALNREDAGEPLEQQVSRFIASRAIALALAGVPGIYLPSLFGSKNDVEAVKGGDARAINRDRRARSGVRLVARPAVRAHVADERRHAVAPARALRGAVAESRLSRGFLPGPGYHRRA